ncbi:MAG: hypothetical protein MUF60_02800 [Vicinamibacterales bacterium]|nr:hypothetical protein [Vicinamibacterales bacterium]
MSTARHDIYIIEDGTGGYLVRPGTFAVSPCTCGIRFRNLTGERATVTLSLPAGLSPCTLAKGSRYPFDRDNLDLSAGASGTVFINWSAAVSGSYPYSVSVGAKTARGNSEPTIIVDL